MHIKLLYILYIMNYIIYIFLTSLLIESEYRITVIQRNICTNIFDNYKLIVNMISYRLYLYIIYNLILK